MKSRTGLGILAGCLLAAGAGGGARPAEAQYFGRQKVQYERFDWRVLETDRFDVHFYPEEATAAQDAARMAERWYARLSAAFQHEFKKKPIVLYADQPDFQQTNTTPGGLNEGTGGFTDALRNRVVMPFTGMYADNDHVLGHELVHVFQYDLASSPGGGGLMGMSRLPGWMIEGMAEYLSLGRVDAHTAMWLRDAALRGELPTIGELTRDTRYFPYRYGQALWAYIAGRWGDRAVPELYRFASRAGWDEAVQRVLGVTTAQISQQWITATREQYLPLLVGKQRPQDAGDPVLVDKDIGAMNLSPVVSPDGRYVAFFGRREIFTIDLYVADAQTGKVVKKLTSPGRSSHFDALSFISSSGTWSPDGRKFAFVVYSDGDQRIAILDVNSGGTDREISVQGVGGVQNPSWSPDGRSIAFTGMAGGISDLYLLDLESGRVRQLMNDRYGDLQPAWSPDGRTIAFSTDRGTATDFRNLTYGSTHLALYDVASGNIRTLDIFPAGKHINPQYSPDGRSLYFIADPDGFSNVYRLSLDDQQLFKVTDVATGISGITDLSPAMSVAARTGRMLFSVFENSGNNVYGIDAARSMGTPANPALASAFAPAALLPPASAPGTGMVAEYLADVSTGLPPAGTTFPTHAYNAGLGLEYVGPPSLGVGVGGPFGGGVSGGVSFFFGDMLGDHQLGAAIQANGTFKDIGGIAAYTNMAHRWSWGAQAGHIPYLTGYSGYGQDENGNISYLQIFQRIYIDQAALMAQYPFSQTRRFEMYAGATRYGFDLEQWQYAVDPFGNLTGQYTKSNLAAPDPIYSMQGGVALVGDNSFFGFTSPVAGQRYRLDVSPTLGTLSYQTLLADYRRYFFFKPFTLAFRGLHYGRYGKDAAGVTKDGQLLLYPLFLGQEAFVRGYASESFDASECQGNTTSCPAFDRLWGSRMSLANVELRVPLFGVSEFGLLNFPFLPTEIAPFFDIGYASGNVNATGLQVNSSDRKPVMSAGITSRVNILGYLVLESYFAYPFQRPDKGWHFGFNLMPGW